MQQSCIKGYYNFNIKPSNCRTVLYQDLSDWMDFDQYVVPDTYIIRVYLMGRDPIEIEVKTGIINKITSVSLGFSQDNVIIPGGIYCFEVESCGVVYKKYRAIDCVLRCKLDTLISTSNLDTDLSYINSLEKKYEMLHIAAEFQNYKTAQKIYKELEGRLDCIHCSC